MSSVATLNNLDYLLPLNEEVFWKTSGKESDYAWSKYNAEREVWRGIEEGLNAVIVNPGIVLSPGFWKQSSSVLFARGYNGNRFYTNGSTGYVAAPDVARAMLELVSKRQFSKRFILVEGNYTYKEIFTRIQTCFNKPAPSINVQPWLLKLLGFFYRLAAFFSGKTSSLTRSVIIAAYQTQKFSGSKIEKELSFKWTPVNDTIAFICSQYQKDLNKGKR